MHNCPQVYWRLPRVWPPLFPSLCVLSHDDDDDGDDYCMGHGLSEQQFE